MIIAIDFDGTCTTHNYPYIGKDIGAIPVLKELIKNGHQLILWTMRANAPKPEDITDEHFAFIKESTDYLDHAVNWFEENEIPLFGIQENPDQKSWTTSKKCYAQLYIDDAALGCPLKFDFMLSDRPFVDWVEVKKDLFYKGYLSETTDH